MYINITNNQLNDKIRSIKKIKHCRITAYYNGL